MEKNLQNVDTSTHFVEDIRTAACIYSNEE